MGCIRRIGCLVVLLLLAGAAWLYRDQWLNVVGRRPAPTATASNPADLWEPLTPDGAARARAAIGSLGQRSGPVFTNVRAGDLAAYIFSALAKQLPPSARGTRAAAMGDRLYLKTVLNPAELGGAQVLGPLGSLLGDRDTVVFGGTFDVVRPGLAEFRVREVKVARLTVPQQMIPRLLRQFERGARPEGVADDALPLVVPNYIGDVRVARGHVTLYKTVP